VLVGLLIGGVLAGQQLIQSARVRNLISQQEGVKAAYFGFQDRYRALPGDYSQANINIPCGASPCFDGNGNGRIEAPNTAGTHEEIVAWAHLSGAGFINGSYTMAASTTTLPTVGNTPANPFGAYVQLANDGLWGTSDHAFIATRLLKHSIKTGNQVPVKILAEIDRKIDDGKPYSGSFQFSTFNGAGAAPEIGGFSAQSCTDVDDASGKWNLAGDQSNCGAASLL
jgi:hypothetical protein